MYFSSCPVVFFVAGSLSVRQFHEPFYIKLHKGRSILFQVILHAYAVYPEKERGREMLYKTI